MDGKETAKRKQVLEGNAFYEIDLECMRKKEKREKGIINIGRTQRHRTEA